MLKMTNIFFLHQGIGDCVMFAYALDKYYQENESFNDNINIFIVRGQIEKEILLLKIIENKNNIIFIINSKGKFSRYITLLKIVLILKFRYLKITNVFAPIFSGSYFNYILIKILRPVNFFSQDEDLFKRNFNSENFLPRIELTDLHYVDYFKLFLEKSQLIKPNSELIKTGKFSINPIKTRNEIVEVAFGIGSTLRESNKMPSIEWFINLLGFLDENLNVKFIFYGGESEHRLFQLIKNKFDHKCEFFINSHPVQLIDRLNRADIIISGTTGPGHLASLSTTNQITLSEITNPFESGPFKENNYNVRAGMKCSPCYRRDQVNGCGILSCLDLISHKKILRIIEKLVFGEPVAIEQYNFPKVQKSSSPIF